jgi:dTDP-D-glucose 4,6-dehydratase
MSTSLTYNVVFIGSHFVNKLKELNPDCKVTIIDKLTYAANIENIKCSGNEIIISDLSFYNSEESLSRLSYIFKEKYLLVF